MTVKDDEIIGGHRQAENRFQDDEPTCPGVKLFEPWQRTEEFRILDRLDYIGFALHHIIFTPPQLTHPYI
jgi:hypothetical protein